MHAHIGNRLREIGGHLTSEYQKPLPAPANEELTRPFWEATRRHELLMPRCRACSHMFYYPRDRCPSCLSDELEWAKVSGRGTVYTYTVVRRPANPAFNEDVPYVLAIVQLDEGPRMLTNIVGCPIEAVKIDMPVVAVFDDVTPEWTLVKFSPT